MLTEIIIIKAIIMLTMTSTEFSEWLAEEVTTRGWSYRELARRAGLSSGAISQVVTQKNFPGIEFCQGIARAFQIPPERVFRQAGHLPPRIIGNNESNEILDYFQALNTQNRQTLLALARTLHEQQSEYKTE